MTEEQSLLLDCWKIITMEMSNFDLGVFFRTPRHEYLSPIQTTLVNRVRDYLLVNGLIDERWNDIRDIKI